MDTFDIFRLLLASARITREFPLTCILLFRRNNPDINVVVFFSRHKALNVRNVGSVLCRIPEMLFEGENNNFMLPYQTVI